MIKTALDIEQDVYDVAKVYFAGIVGGTVYKDGCRPLDSENEDVVVYVSNADAKQIQAGDVYVNVFVPDIPNETGCKVPDKGRMQYLASMDKGFVSELNDTYLDYEYSLGSATQFVRVYNAEQHFVSMKISFRRITF